MYPTYCLALTDEMKLSMKDSFTRMKECKLFDEKMQFLDFVEECFSRGYNDYLKELSIVEGLNDI